MAFKIGDKVKMIIEFHARAECVWGAVGVVTEIINTGTPVERINVKFPDGKLIRGGESAQFELA